ncbi:DUF6381 family protein [Streptomyces sp. LARHCF249]
MRAKAKELMDAADRSQDPDEKQRLRDKARRLQEQSDQEGRMDDRGMDPM